MIRAYKSSTERNEPEHSFISIIEENSMNEWNAGV